MLILKCLRRTQRNHEREPAIKLEADVKALVNVTKREEMKEFDKAFNLGADNKDSGEGDDAEDT